MAISLRRYPRFPEAKFFREDAFQRLSPLGQNVPPPDILAELEDVGKARGAHLRGDLGCRHTRRLGPSIEKAIDQNGRGVARWQGHVDTQLEAPPNRPVEQLSVVRRRHH
jgi:hypothetical protein